LGYDPNSKCIKCFQNSNYLFYCEHCNGTLCADCVITEKTECTYCQICSHISVGNRCEICGRTNELPVSKKIKRCPNCTSTNLKDINKKASGLTSEFYSAIESINFGLDTVKGFADRYAKIVSDAKQLRRERFGLYPIIEHTLFRLSNDFFETTQRASELLDKVCQHIYHETKTLNLKINIPISQLITADKIIKTIKTHARSYTNLIEDFLEKPRNDLLEIQGKIAELKNYTFLFDEASERFEPSSYELKIAAYPNVKMLFPNENRKRTGTLFITNKKLYFIPRFQFIFRFYGKTREIELSSIRDVETKSKVFFGNQIIMNLSQRKKVKIKGSNAVLKQLNDLFTNLFVENENFYTNDIYSIEEFSNHLKYYNLQEKIERRIKDLKEIPFSRTSVHPIKPKTAYSPKPFPRETEEIRNLRIELKAAKDTLREIIKAFNDRTISPEIYFSRREKTQKRILSLEEELTEAQKSHVGVERLNELLDYYTRTQANQYSLR
jgi:hypothetical protein